MDDFGTLPDGGKVQICTLTSKGGVVVRLMTYGATIVSLHAPDRTGKSADIVLGYDKFEGYLDKHNPYFGAVIGRYANRIGKAKFTLNGVEYKLNANDGANTLHGGLKGFDKVNWTAKQIDERTVEFSYLSKDGEEGFPGNLTVHARYTLSDANELRLDYTATTDRDTVVNLTNHAYFNLAGQGSGLVTDQEMTIHADQFTPIDAQCIPEGPLAKVEGTPMDFRKPHKIGERIDQDFQQLRNGRGYDHNYVVTGSGLRVAAVAHDPKSGRVLKLSTTEPGVQFYSGNFLSGDTVGKGGEAYQKRTAFCLEPGHYPDSPNRPDFPSTVLKAGSTYRSTTLYEFSTR